MMQLIWHIMKLNDGETAFQEKNKKFSLKSRQIQKNHLISPFFDGQLLDSIL